MAAQKGKGSGNKGREGAPAWAWLVVGLLVGLFVALLVHLQGQQRPAGTGPAPSASTERDARAVRQPEGGEGPGEPEFDFYSILPEMEIPVPEPEEQPQQAPEEKEQEQARPREAPELGENEAWALQLGSFRSEPDADRFRARLSLLGLEPHIQEVTIDGADWYRVRLGPLRRTEELQAVRQRLRENEIDAMVLKLQQTD
ncbi:Cell division protein FtsN [Thiohalospira halophila DSM 15071]|uniref:Cell division protein FtsN n=1 Tax=Thiohalospira halophila DSM 15071 TaxID=1123397 RepID=A0A1I1V569_9GAMM|nr:SPOR domain-containing protein [Thiohalospira halophila]SFD77168.1 Cell division protein FtsN [Thiohalospira halophila DSM 15071]